MKAVNNVTYHKALVNQGIKIIGIFIPLTKKITRLGIFFFTFLFFITSRSPISSCIATATSFFLSYAMEFFGKRFGVLAGNALWAVSYQGKRNFEACYKPSHTTETLIDYIVCCAHFDFQETDSLLFYQCILPAEPYA